MAKELEKRGAHLLCIKDMSGLLKPYAAKKLVTALKNEVGLPIHLHTHDTSGNQVAALSDGRRGRGGYCGLRHRLHVLHHQPALPERGGHRPRRARSGTPDSDPKQLQTLSDYWADVRLRYEPV